MVGCVITAEGVGPIDEGKGQIGGANVIWDTRDDGNAGSTAQPACGLRGTPPVCYCLSRSRVHLGNDD